MNKRMLVLIFCFVPLMLYGMHDEATSGSSFSSTQAQQPRLELFSHRLDFISVVRTALLFAKMVQAHFCNSKTDVGEVRVCAQLEALAQREQELVVERDHYLFNFGAKSFFPIDPEEKKTYLSSASAALFMWVSEVWKLVEARQGKFDGVRTPPLCVDGVQLLDPIVIPLAPIPGSTLVIQTTFDRHGFCLYDECWASATACADMLACVEISDRDSRKCCIL